MCYFNCTLHPSWREFLKFFKFIYLWFRCVFIAVRGLSRVALSEGVQLAVNADYPATIMVDDVVYYLDSEIVAEVDESAILGYTNSYTNDMPKKNGETNFNRELNMPYAKVENGIAVLYHNEWVLCLPK